MEWKGTPNNYVFYENLDQCPPKMQQLLSTYGWFFDDEWYYWQPKTRKGTAANVVKKIAIIYYPQRGLPAEKHKRKIKGKQLKLTLL